MAEAYTIVFQPSGRRGEVPAGKTVLAAAQELGVGIEASCGGKGVCGKCRIIVEEGRFEKLGLVSGASHVSERGETEEKFFTEDELSRGYRLACLTQITGDLVVTVPEESRSVKQVILEKGKKRTFTINPAVKQYTIKLPAPTLEDARDDRRRLLDVLEEKEGLSGLTVDYPVLRTLPRTLRENDWLVTVSVWQGKEVIRVESGEAPHSLGIAIDIGTTTLAAFLCDLVTGELLSKASRMNPEIGYGEDVLARISYAMANEDGGEKLQRAMQDAVSELAAQMTGEIGRTPSEVDEMVLVYNTAMHHFTLGLDSRYVGRSPFAPAASDALDIKARDLGILINPSANIHSLPIEAGFVGADNVAVLLAEEPYNSESVKLIIDIGTNGEIDLGNKERLLSTSCATGPALEGAQIAFGMRAAPGAIERIEINPETYEPRYKVIGKDEWFPDISFTGAQGICGSGIIDVVAELYRAGIISKAGRINTKLDTPRVRKDDKGKAEYVLAWAPETAVHKDIVITQGDIRAVQLAKGAIYVGAKYLMEKYGIDHVDEVILAGAFGSYINKKSAMALGMFPDCALEKVQAVGNAAGDGARIALLNVEKRKEAAKVAREVEFIETAVEPDFQTRFMEALAIPHAKDEFPHLKEGDA
ncbi:ASKHA domain-containing protein [Schwartzia succinivorans]|nr:ASKHA domain-containing protein [Schwartzia succinivorans]